MRRRRNSHKKLYIGIALIVIIAVAAASAAYIYITSQPTPPKVAVPGVQVGDWFIYSLKGYSQLISSDAATPSSIYDYNNTDYYKVTVTAISGPFVSLGTLWHFKNGTDFRDSQTINLSTGDKTSTNGFWAIYSANLTVNDKLRPKGFDALVVNNQNTTSYTSGDRSTNGFGTANEFTDINNPSGSDIMQDVRSVAFDKQTGMLIVFSDYQSYIENFNQPKMRTLIEWTLTSTSVWTI